MKTTFVKIHFIALLLMSVLFWEGCGQKKCEYSQTGYFIYLNNPQVTDSNITIRAYFIPDQPSLNIDSLSHALLSPKGANHYYHNLVYGIKGRVPSEFKRDPDTPIRVMCDLKIFYQYIPPTGPTSIVCLEKI